MSDVDQPPGSGGGNRQLLAVLASSMAAVLSLAYLGVFTWVGGGIPRGTGVAGVEIGGMADAEAVQTLNTELTDRAETVRIGIEGLEGKEREYPAERLGLSFDAEATVAAVPRREAAPQALVSQLGGQDVRPVVDVDQQRLDRRVRVMARRVEDPVRQPRIEFDGLSVVVIDPRSGNELDRPAAASAIAEQYLLSDNPIELAVEPVVPYASEDEVNVVAETEAQDAISGPVTLTVGAADITVSPEQIASVLSFLARKDGIWPKVDAPLLRELIAGPLAEVGNPAKDANFDVSSGTPKVVPAETGRGVDDTSLADGLVQALAADDRAATLELERVEPALTTAEAKDLGIKEVTSTFTQEFPYAAYRVTNIGVASDKIDGTLLEPGETFSLNDVVGERTPENGFVEGYVIVGNRLVEDYGGAVSTITTAMWHTAFFAGMTRVEQRAHGFWISRYLPGLEATVSWGNLDLKFRNDTPYGVYITSSLTDTSVTTTIWSTQYWDVEADFGPRADPTPAGTVYDDADGCVAQYGVDGFDITVTRVWSRNGEVERREPLFTSYEAAPTVICAPKPEPKPEPTDKPTDKPTDEPSDKPANSNPNN
ncbi:MAG: VanW family protein [Actinomycetia bacterium]|nr:VanW family protein [Actinomycetes bacterium]